MRERAFILFEGDNDTRFHNEILYRLFSQKYRLIKTWKYSKAKKEDTENFIKRAKEWGTCIFVHDFDNAECITKVKRELNDIWLGLDEEEIHIVIEEIESWYLAGLSLRSAKKIGILVDDFQQTNDVTKGVFLSLKPKEMTETEYYNIFLRYFDLTMAKQRNASFRRFLEKCIDSVH